MEAVDRRMKLRKKENVNQDLMCSTKRKVRKKIRVTTHSQSLVKFFK